MPNQPRDDSDAMRRQAELIAWEGFARAALTGLLNSGQYYGDRDGACEEARLMANLMTTNRRNFLEFLEEG